jgi:hypothetical protein
MYRMGSDCNGELTVKETNILKGGGKKFKLHL